MVLPATSMPAPTTLQERFCVHSPHCEQSQGQLVCRSADASSAAAASESVQTHTPGMALWVGQGEFAAASAEEGVSLIGSREATTCVMVALYNRATQCACLGHLDGHKLRKSVNAMVVAMGGDDAHSNDEIEVNIVGGYDDEENTSIKIIRELTRALQQMPQVFVPKVVCVGAANTVQGAHGHPLPIVTACAIRVHDGSVVAACDCLEDMPCGTLRHARFLSGTCTSNIFNRSLRCIEITPFHFQFDRRVAAYLSSLPDAELLQRSSTSPFAEGPHFCDNARAMYKMMLQNPDLTALWPKNNQPWRYRWNGEKWEQFDT